MAQREDRWWKVLPGRQGTGLGAACEEQDAGFGVKKAKGENSLRCRVLIRVVPPVEDIGP